MRFFCFLLLVLFFFWSVCFLGLLEHAPGHTQRHAKSLMQWRRLPHSAVQPSPPLYQPSSSSACSQGSCEHKWQQKNANSPQDFTHQLVLLVTPRLLHGAVNNLLSIPPQHQDKGTIFSIIKSLFPATV